MIHFWYSICLLYLINNIQILFEESYELNYNIVNQIKPVQYLNCFNLKEIIINKTIINLNEIKQDFNYRLRWIQKNKQSRDGKLISNVTIDKIIDQIKLTDYLIYQNRVCFIVNKTEFRPFFELFIGIPIGLSKFVFDSETFSFFKLKNLNLGLFDRIKVHHKAYPYSNCTKNYSHFKCLNDKIKRRQRLSRYYYDSNDNGTIELNYRINQTIIDNEIRTIKECNQIDCKINLFYPYTGAEIVEPISLRSFLYIPKLDFYLQFSGLISLFLNISIYQLSIKFINSAHFKLVKIKLIKSIKFIKSKFKFLNLQFKKIKEILIKLNLRFFKLKKKYFKFKYFLLLILIVCFLILLIKSINLFLDKRDNPQNKIATFNSFSSQLSIVICVEIDLVKGDDYDIYKRSLFDLEKDTDNGLEIIINEIYLEFLNKKIPVDWQLKSDLVAFDSNERCFHLRIFPKEPKYQSIFSITNLKIKLKIEFATVYILTDGEIFNSESYIHYPSFNFRKKIVERSKLNQIKKCKDYSLVDNCKSKWNCIDKCATRQVYNQIKNLTKNSFIHKKYFTDKEWSNLFVDKSQFNSILYNKIKKECKDKYSKLDPCIDIKFEQYSRINEENKIDLYYLSHNLKEEEPTKLKLLFDLLNIQSIIFNLNIFKLLKIISFKFNSKFNKIIKLLIYLICLAGFIIHIWSIVDEIINSELFQNQFYELIDSILMPDLIFCFDINQTKIDPNYKLTYEYLDKITEELREDQIFNRIEYLNDNKWIELNNKTNFKDGDYFEISVFYFLDRKCFKIRQNIEYNRNQFYFKDGDALVIKIFLNKLSLNNTYFFTKTKNMIQFTKINNLVLREYNKYTKKTTYKSYELIHQLIKSDKFNLIKNPLSFANDYNLNDDDKSFKKMINDFETKLNLQTFKLPFKKGNFNLKNELNDDLFIQFYNNLEKNINQSNSIHNYQRQYAINYLEIIDKDQELSPDFKFSLSFYRKVVVVTYETSSTKLIINLLNALSLWFNLCIFDLHIYLYSNKIKLLFNYIYKLLLKFKKKIYLKHIYDNQLPDCTGYHSTKLIKHCFFGKKYTIIKGPLVLSLQKNLAKPQISTYSLKSI